MERAPQIQPVLKIAEFADFDVLVRFMEEYYAFDRLPFDRPRASAALSRLITDPSIGTVWLINLDSEAIGYIALTLGYSLEHGGRDAFIDELFLTAPFRGRGFGRQTMALVEAEVRSLHIQALHLEVARGNDAAQALYRKVGYESRDRFLMTKTLQQGAD